MPRGAGLGGASELAVKRAWGVAPAVLLAGYCVFAAWAGFLEGRAEAPGQGSRWVTTHEETLAPARLLLEGETDVGFVFEPHPRDLVEGGA